MKEMFTWVPWFTELAQKVADGGEEFLNERAKSVDWGIEDPLFARESVDPLTFVAYLAQRAKQRSGLRAAFLSLGREFGLSNSQLAEESDGWHLPRSEHLYWDYQLQANDRVAWNIFQQAARGSIEPEAFRAALDLNSIALPTLSRLLFLINPNSYLPLLGPSAYCGAYGLTSVPSKTTWEKYSSVVDRIRADYPGCALFEIELFPRLQRPESEGGRRMVVRPDRCWLVNINPTDYQQSESRDRWREDFQPNNWIRTDEDYEGLSDVKSGDILLVQYGTTAGRGIGVVVTNDYRTGWSHDRAIHVLWVNKGEADITSTNSPGAPGRQVFREPTNSELQRFRQSEAYGSTWKMLDRTTYRREIEAALDADASQLGEVWRLLKARKNISEIREAIGNAHTIRQIHRLLLEERIPAPEIRRRASRVVRRLVREHADSFSASTQEKLSELISRCDGSSSPDQRLEVRHDRNRILYGPPGTGKTYATVGHALAIIDANEVKDDISDEDRQRFRDLRFGADGDLNGSTEGRIAMVTFHQNYAYEDFVEGIRPRLVDRNDGEETESSAGVAYQMRPGVFRSICGAADAERKAARAEGRKPRRFVLIIDEINRGNIPKILGELITIIEPSRRLGAKEETRVTLPYSRDEFGVPDNLYIIGTMNTADRSIQQLDTALRRRFTFVEMMPDPDHHLIPDDVTGVNCRKMLRAMNERIALLMDREHQIGHTYLLEVESIEDLADRFRNRIFPLLQEYFYDDWRRIDAVLGGNAFVQKDKARDGHSKQLIEKFDLLDEDRVIHERLADNDPAWKAAEEYQRIYEPKSD